MESHERFIYFYKYMYQSKKNPPSCTSIHCPLHQSRNVRYYPKNRRRCIYGIPFQRRRIQERSCITKNNKTVGRYVLVEQLNNICPKAHKWLLAMLNHMETIQYYRHIEAWERLCTSKELPSNIPPVTRTHSTK